ncbi:hypothetical protein SARC_10261, partial [Sphaeroforma arctica JP610]
HLGSSVTQKRVPKLKVSVKAAMLVSDIPRSFHVYIVVICTDFGVWTVHRRFSQFLELHRYITGGHMQFPANDLKNIFPPKRFFLNPSTKVAKIRIEELHNYMQALLQSPAAYEMRVWNFLGAISFARHFVPSHPLPQTLVTPSLIAHEFLHSSDRNIAVTFVEFAARLLRSVVTRDGNEQPVTKGVVLPTLREMVVMLIHTGRMSFTSFTLSLLYVKQIRDLRGKHSIRGCPHLLLIAALIVTAKFLYDEPPHPIVNNWFTPREIWHMELKILTGIQFNLNVSEKVYSTFVNRMDKSMCKHFLSGDLDMQNQKQLEAKQHYNWADQPLFGGEGAARRLGTWIYLSDDSKQRTAEDIAQQRQARTAPTSPVPPKHQSQPTSHQSPNATGDAAAPEAKPILRSPSYDNLSEQLLLRRASGASVIEEVLEHSECIRANGYGDTGTGTECAGSSGTRRAHDNQTVGSAWSEDYLSEIMGVCANGVEGVQGLGTGKGKAATVTELADANKSPLLVGSVWGCARECGNANCTGACCRRRSQDAKHQNEMRLRNQSWSDDQLHIVDPSTGAGQSLEQLGSSGLDPTRCKTQSQPRASMAQVIEAVQDVR